MDDEELGQALGYVQWASEICSTMQEDEAQKEECIQFLKSNKASGFALNQEAIKRLHAILRKKQLQQIAMKEEVYSHIQKTIAEKISHFQNMYAELFVREIAIAVHNVYQNTILLNDVLLRQEKLLAAMTSETFIDFIPHVFFLCEKEKNLKEGTEKKTALLHQNALKLIEHMFYNYFNRLAKLAHEKEFQEDHYDLFLKTYLLCILARAIMKAQGMDVSELLQKEQQFTRNLIIVNI